MMKNENHEYLQDAARGNFDSFMKLIHFLRGENGCPWDRVQTPESLSPCLADEMAEVFAGMDVYRKTGDGANLCEELGDVLLQIALIADYMEKAGSFTIEDVVAGVAKKMLRRHPHVFGENSLMGWSRAQQEKHAEELIRWSKVKNLKEEGVSWADIKALEKEEQDLLMKRMVKENSERYETEMKPLREMLVERAKEQE